jgi:DHA2 family multidrug resistance protein-like MFS transporter
LPASVAVIGGVAATVLFIARQRRLEDPLVDVRLFRAPTFTAALTANTFSYFVILGSLMLFAQYLQLVLGLSALEAGLWTVPAMGGLIVGSLLTPQLVKRARPAAVMAGGLVVAAAGFALLSRVGTGSDLALAVIASAIFCVGLAPVTTLVVNLVLAAAPHERAGAAAGLSETTTELGGALGIAVLGTIAAAVYRTRLTNHVPQGLSGAARHAARDTLGGAVDAARHLPVETGRVLVSEAQHGFGAGLRVAAVTSAAIVLVVAAVTLALFRKVRTDAKSGVPAVGSLPLEKRGEPIDTDRLTNQSQTTTTRTSLPGDPT